MTKGSKHSEEAKTRISAHMKQYRCKQRAMKRINDYIKLNKKGA